MPQIRDGVYTRSDRRGFWISFEDAQGRRRQEKTDAPTLQQARSILAQKRAEAEKARVMGYTPPSRDTFAEFEARYLKHQKARLTPRAYERTRGIVETHLRKAFGSSRLAEIRRADVQRYVTDRSGEVGAGSVAKELNVLKHALSMAVEWELIPVNTRTACGLRRLPPAASAICSPRKSRRCLRPVPPGSSPSCSSCSLRECGAGNYLGCAGWT